MTIYYLRLGIAQGYEDLNDHQGSREDRWVVIHLAGGYSLKDLFARISRIWPPRRIHGPDVICGLSLAHDNMYECIWRALDQHRFPMRGRFTRMGSDATHA